MKVLVTGGSGFIGTRLLTELRSAGYDVVNLDLRPSETHNDVTVEGDIRDFEAVKSASSECTAIIHLAAVHRDDVKPIELYESTNVGGAHNVVAAAAANQVQHIVFTSSVAIYGLEQGVSREGDTPRPFNEYGRTKLKAEQIFTDWKDSSPEHALNIVRPCVVFGESNRGNVYTLIHQIAVGRFVMVGDGTNKKSMAYVGNIVALLNFLLEHPDTPSPMNYADKPDLTTNELVATIKQALRRHKSHLRLPSWLGMAGGLLFDGIATITHRQLPISSVRVRKFTASTVADTSLLESTGFQAPFSLSEGLSRMIDSDFS